MKNDEKIKEIFPNATIKICKNKGFTYIEVEKNDKWIADFNIEWWNAEYFEKTCEQKKNVVIDKIRAELIQLIQNGTIKIESGNEALFNIIDKYKSESEK